MQLACRDRAAHNAEIAARIGDGSLKIPEIQTFGFDDIGEAIDLQATRHVRGKLAIKVG